MALCIFEEEREAKTKKKRTKNKKYIKTYKNIKNKMKW